MRFFVSWKGAFLLIISPLFVECQTEPCPQDTALQGYTTITQINRDMQAELDLIAGGQPAQMGYTFTLCPDTAFDATEMALTPLLNNATFVCGRSGSSGDNCLIFGGQEQIRIESSTDASVPIEVVGFFGLSFVNFTGTAVAARASSATTANFLDARFLGFDTILPVMSIDSDMDGRAMNVDMSRVSIGSGSSNVFFSNDQGTLSVRNLEVTGLLATSLLSTASGGVSFLQDSSITSSNIVSVTSTVNGGQQTVTGSSVSGMTGLGTAFSADGSSTRLTLSDVDVVENTIASQQWVGISGLGGADVNANRVNITGNDGIIFGLQTSSGAQAAFSQSTFSRNVAPGAVTSSAVFAVNGTATIERSIFDNNQGFTSVALSFFGGEINIRQSCLQNSASEFVLFQDSMSIVRGDAPSNFIDSYDSAQCPGPGNRLFQEDIGAQCFTGGQPDDCFGTCASIAEASACLAAETSMPTASPTSSTLRPTVSPSDAITPTGSPVLLTPSPTRVDPGLPTTSPSLVTPDPTATPDDQTFEPTEMGIPTEQPVAVPTSSPSELPEGETFPPTRPVTPSPTISPSQSPTIAPTTSPSLAPMGASTFLPTGLPNGATFPPSRQMTVAPSRGCIPRPPPSKGGKRSNGKRGKKSNGKGGKGGKKGKGSEDRRALRSYEAQVFHIPGWNNGNGVWIAPRVEDDAEDEANDSPLPFCPEPTPSPTKRRKRGNGKKGKGGKRGSSSSSSKGGKGRVRHLESFEKKNLR